jgi:glycerophosphoryl diester phosphodiesterase
MFKPGFLKSSNYYIFLLVIIIISACSKGSLYEPELSEQPISQPISSNPFFSFTDQGEFISINWYNNSFNAIAASYNIKIMGTGIDTTLSKGTSQLKIKRNISFYHKKIILSVNTTNEENIKLDSLVYTNDYSKFFNSNNKLIAHRGLSSLYPENTAIAFEKAAEAGFEYVECDLWLTKDKHWVVIHDETIDRTSNGTGKISDYTFAELEKLNFGYPKNFGDKYPQKILSINEFIKLCKNKGVKPLIEIKQAATSQDYLNLLQIVNNALFYHDYTIHSFSTNVLHALRKIDNKVILGLISRVIIPSNFNDLKVLYPCFYNLNSSQLNLEQPIDNLYNNEIFKLYSNGIYISIWTVTNQKYIQHLSQNNMFVITNILPLGSK